MELHAPAYETGPILADVLLQFFCQGIIFSQFLAYRLRFGDDSRCMKAYVHTLNVAALVQTVSIGYRSVMLFVVSGNNPLASRVMVHTTVDILINGIVCTLCQIFWVHRCWKVTGHNKWVLAILSASCLAVFVTAILLCVSSGFGDRIPSDFISSYSSVILFWTFGTIALEILITSILIRYLHNSKTGEAHLDRVLKQISRVTWSTPILPCVFMLVAAIMNRIYAHSPTKYMWLKTTDQFFVLVTGKFYTLGLMLTINSRTKWRERMKSHDIGRVSLGPHQWENSVTAIAASVEMVRRVSPISRRVSRTGDITLAVSESVIECSGNRRIDSVTFTSPVIDARERGILSSNEILQPSMR